MRRLFVPVAGGALAERARHGRVLVAGLIVLLCFVSLSFIDPRTVAQEVVGQDRWHMAMDSALGRAGEGAGGKAGFGFQGMCKRLPGDDRRSGWQIHYGVARERAGPECQRRPAARGNNHEAIRRF